ncbi:hypothetical protein F5Y06DRAFT_290790 [Hypoxylon sp. FL0890]|nr:hypothetical protein F5Y06DRAFT_290790 [Hypoxylon sp. FL0890]
MASHAPIRKESILAKSSFDLAESNSADESSEKKDVIDTEESNPPDESIEEKDVTDTKEPDSPNEAIEKKDVIDTKESDSPDGIPKRFSTLEKKWISTIFEAQSMDELADLFSSAYTRSMNRRLALAIYNREDDHSTIEFRHFQSTMDYDLAWKWVRITAGIVQLASKPASEYYEKLHIIADKYRAMRTKWKEYSRARAFGRETTDPWLDGWQSMLALLDLEDDFTFWADYVAQLPERNRTT